MQAVAHSPEFAKKVGIPQSVGQEFAAADKTKDIPDHMRAKVAKHLMGKK